MNNFFKNILLIINSFFKDINIIIKKTVVKDRNMVYLVYDTNQPKDDNEEWGTMYFKDIECRFISGRYGRGHAPRGSYGAKIIYEYSKDSNPDTFERMGLFNIAFQVPIELIKISSDATQKEIERAKGMSGIAIHPDGGIEGTLGCFGLHPESQDHLIRIRNSFRHFFDVKNCLMVEVC